MSIQLTSYKKIVSSVKPTLLLVGCMISALIVAGCAATREQLSPTVTKTITEQDIALAVFLTKDGAIKVRGANLLPLQPCRTPKDDINEPVCQLFSGEPQVVDSLQTLTITTVEHHASPGCQTVTVNWHGRTKTFQVCN